MHLRDARQDFGVAFQRRGDTYRLAPFGLIQTSEGQAHLQILVQVPEADKVTVDKALEMRAQAKGLMDFNDPRLQTCWW